MMKKIFFALAFLAFLVSSAQIKPNFDGVNYTPLTTTEINELTGMLEGDLQYNETTKTMYVYNGSAWVNTGVPLINASGFSGNLTTSIVNLQLLAEAVDSLTISGGSGDLWSDLVDSDILVDTDGSYDLGNITSQFLTAHFERYSTPSNDSNWWVLDVNSSNHFGFGYSSIPTSAFSPIYTLNNTGTPSLGTDLIDKDYADANYTGGASSDLDLTGNILSLTNPATPSNEVDLSALPVLDDYVDLTSSQTISGIKTHTTTTIVSDAVLRILDTSVSSDMDLFITGTPGVDERFVMSPSDAGSNLFYNFESEEWQIDGTAISTDGGSSPPFPDNAPIIEDNLDATKTITIDASNITTGTNRTITMPDAPVNLGAISNGDKGDIIVSGTALTIDVGAVDNSNIDDGVDATRIYTGEVSNTEFNYLNGVTSDIQTQLNSKVATTIAGRTGDAVEAVMIQDEADYISDGDPGTNEIVFCRACAPMQVGTTATIDLDKYRGYDDRAIDAATFTFANLKTGAAVLIEIDRATDATYSGVTIAHTTGVFAADTRQLVTIFILPSGDALRDYKDLE